CALSVLTFCPLAWSRRALGSVFAVSALAALALIFGWVDSGKQVAGKQAFDALQTHWLSVGSQLALFITSGLFTLALAVTDYWKTRSAGSLLLGLWVFGTVIFASLLNWTVNARSVLPLIPAAGILTVRRLETIHELWTRRLLLQVPTALARLCVPSRRGTRAKLGRYGMKGIGGFSTTWSRLEPVRWMTGTTNFAVEISW